ncbi:HugZ family protein [Methylibium sp.]|uniref:HugZ family pyridoxamine 5'-phosphate oxidase n=1 Tax=Methylibium sp. TaxID=2067992 RepID=UPI003D1139B0
MDPSQAHALKALLETQPVASLATLHNGEPAASMVPFALLPAGQGVVIHVSRLATHTKDMLANPAVGLLVLASPAPGLPVQALPRVSLQGRARQCLNDAAEYTEARQAYLARFPESEPMFGFADFSLFVIGVRSARFVGGFAQAGSVTAERFVAIMAAGA